VLISTGVDPSLLLFGAQKYNEMGQITKVEQAMQILANRLPDNPEAWYDLAGIQMAVNKPNLAVASLRKALENSAKRQQTNPEAPSLYSNVIADARFVPLVSLPEFQQILQTFKPSSPSGNP
jgi:tetratricopeptide (TPR) repeat protein